MIQINELNIRVPGIEKGDGESLAKDVTKRLAMALPNNEKSLHIPDLTIRIDASRWEGDHTSVTDIADAISQEIVRQLKTINL